MSKRSTRYEAGQAVEVLRPDFTRPGQPETWQEGVVDRVEPVSDRLVKVVVQLSGGVWSPHMIGPRGGNRHIRPAS